MDLASDYDEKAATEQALRLSASEASEERLRQEEEWEIALAKRASLGCSPLHSHAEALAFKFWSTGRLGYDDRTSDCFFALHGSYQAELHSRHAFADLAALRGLPPGEPDDHREVLLFDNDNDEDLLAVQEDAAEAMAGAVYDGPLACVRAIAKIVSQHMGGPYGPEREAEMAAAWAASSSAVKRRRGRPIVPAAQLRVGLAVHRALLFKFLADASNVPCCLVGGGQCRDTLEATAQAVVRISDRQLAVDLTASPGALRPWVDPQLAADIAGDDEKYSTRPPSVELQRVAVADTAPNLAQMSAAPVAPSDASIARRSRTSEDAAEAARGPHAREGARKLLPAAGAPAAVSPFSQVLAQRSPLREASFTGGSDGAGDGAGGIGLSAATGSGAPIARRPSQDNQTGLAAARRGAARGQGPNAAVPSGGSTTEYLKSGANVSGNAASSGADTNGGAANAGPEVSGSAAEPGVDVGGTPGNVGSARMPVIGVELPAEERSQGVPPEVLRALLSAAGDTPPEILEPGVKLQQQPAQQSAQQPMHSSAEASHLKPMSEQPVQQLPQQPTRQHAGQQHVRQQHADAPRQHASDESAHHRAQPAAQRSMDAPMQPASPPAQPQSPPGWQRPPPQAATASPLRRGSSDVSSQTSRSAGLGRQMSLADLQRAEAALRDNPQPLSQQRPDGLAELPLPPAAVVPTAVVHDLAAAPPQPRRRLMSADDDAEEAPQQPPPAGGEAISPPPLPLRRSHSAGEVARGPSRAASQELPAAAPLELQHPQSQQLQRLHLPEAGEWEIAAEEVLMGPRIGIGSFGEVYRGSWRHTDVAVKRLLDQDVHEAMVKEFRDEVAIMKRLKHPNVVLFMGACTQPPHLCIVTQFVARGSLFRLLHRTTPPPALDDKRRLLMALDIARGMHYLHACRPPIVHRDLKSPNLLVDKDFTVKVCDFGLSRVRHSTWLSSKSQAGTPEWCAPEVLRSQSYNEKSDVWSFGVVLWELATGLEPWADASPMQVVGAVGWGGATLDIPDTVDPGLAAIIRACWTDPEQRPSFGQLITSIRELAAARGLMGPARQPASPRPQMLQQHASGQPPPQQPLPLQRQQNTAEAPQRQPMPPPAVRSAFMDAEAHDAPQKQQAPSPDGTVIPISAGGTLQQTPQPFITADWQRYSRAQQAGGSSAAASAASAGTPAGNIFATQSLPALAVQARVLVSKHSSGDIGSGGSGGGGSSHTPPLAPPLAPATSLPLSTVEPEDDVPVQPGSPPRVGAVSRDVGSGAPSQNGELAEPSARKLAAEAARVAGNKFVRGLNTGFKAGVGGVTAGAAGLVGAVRGGAGRLESAVLRTASSALSHSPSQHHSEADDSVQGATPQTAKEANAGGPFGWVHLGRRASDASTVDSPARRTSTDESGSGPGSAHSGGRMSRQGSGAAPQLPASGAAASSTAAASGATGGPNPRSRAASGALSDIEEQAPAGSGSSG